MIGVATQIQQILDALGIQLDQGSFENLVKLIPLDKLTFYQKTALAFALYVFGAWLRKRHMDAQQVAVPHE